jgi:hypothetical protein
MYALFSFLFLIFTRLGVSPEGLQLKYLRNFAITRVERREYSGQWVPLNPVQKGPVIPVERGLHYMVDFAY